MYIVFELKTNYNERYSANFDVFHPNDAGGMWR